METGDPRPWEDGAFGTFADRPTLLLPEESRVRTRMTAVLREEAAAIDSS